MNQKKDLVIFDGDCGICTKSAQMIQKRDMKLKRFDVKPYQVLDLPKIHIGLNEEKTTQSMYLITKEGSIYSHARAVLETAKRMGGFYSVIGFLFANNFFAWLLKPIYKLIAKNRAKISQALGLNACTIPQK